ncbi:enolase C-terminal domain-like protein [Rhodopila sp.]|jgi:mandelate racemase|uniref:enolase C-terminal domain-like protein n=1 Tax=Rhodopila sp. TaxID=2480087 RepID=UPI002B7C8DCF|nr:enolase C-terminal domain-like protein [Rhodopila sp.]HVZ08283.1 enolase C-terminal domain-like protein [Rhodopila sp.]
MASHDTIQSIRTIPVIAPLPRPLLNASGCINDFPLVLIDVQTGGGVVGRAYSHVYFPELLPALDATIRGIGRMIEGQALAPRDVYTVLQRRLRLLGTKNLVGSALGGLDMALWDAFARGRNEPLVRALGSVPRPLRAYYSVGMYRADEAEGLVEETLSQGFTGLKIKLGFPTLAEDLAVVRAVRRGLGDRCALMVDYNQSLTPSEGLARCRALDDEGLVWIEEPIPADDFHGCAAIAAACKTPIQIGENFQGPPDMRAAIAAKAMDYVMPDPQFIWGVSGWLEAAALAGQAGIEMSSHVHVEASSHLMCAAPTAHWLEYMDVAAKLRREPYPLENGMVTPPDRPGIGLEWDEAAVARHRAG